MNDQFNRITTVPVGTGIAVLTPDGELNPAFVHALMRANDAEAVAAPSREQWQRDSDMIFKQITSGDFKDIGEAEAAVVYLYLPDMTISRQGISHALNRLDLHYAAQAEDKAP